MTPVVQAKDLSKEFVSDILRKRFRSLDGLNLEVQKNETFGLLGLNGAGKTTMLKLLLGLIRPTSGEANVLGFPAGDKRALAKVGFLPEQPYFYSYLTAREFLDFSGELCGMSPDERRERSEELLKMVSMLEAADRPVRKYSKGMTQRMGIAQALINDPELVFLDEPMSGLDPIGRRDVRLIMMKLKEQGKSLFFNSHLLPDVNEVCDRVAILHRGKLLSCVRVHEISSRNDYRDLENFFLNSVQRAEAEFQETGTVKVGAVNS
jgi:ABC-2 type transport system ATP-binding protein